MVNFDTYLKSICDNYAQWGTVYTPTDVVGRRVKAEPSPLLFDLNLMVQAVQPAQENPRERQQTVERLGVLDGLRKYAKEQVLLVGRPGSGKSTALQRLVLDEAEKTQRGEQATIPVLVALRHYDENESVIDWIRRSLRIHAAFLENPEIDGLLREKGFLLLFDGINELPSQKARQNLTNFRRENPGTPMIFTTRDLGVGGDLEIGKKLEMQPLNETQMREFVKRYLPEQGEEMLRQLGGRLQEFGETPLLLWMLCSLFKTTGKVPPNLALVFRQFCQGYYDKLKQDVPISDESRRWCPLILQQLAWKMTQGREATELQVAISQSEAEEILTEYLQAEKFDQPRNRAMKWLGDLCNHHLLQLGANHQIQFLHQLIQEYFTAEYLLKLLPHLGDEELQRKYLNYLKWTEPLALMLELLEDEAQALRVVRLALEVDLQLGARLAGKVKPQFQAETVALVAGLKVSQEAKIQLLGITGSNEAILPLQQALNHEDDRVRYWAALELRDIGNEVSVPALIQALNDENDSVRSSAAYALVNIGNEAAVPALIQALNDENDSVRSSAADALGNIGNEAAVPALIQALKDEDDWVRYSAADALGDIGNEVAVPALIQALNDEEGSVGYRAGLALRKIANSKTIPELTKLLKTIPQIDIFVDISSTQESCKFYNYDLTQPKPPTESNQDNPIAQFISVPLMNILHLSDLHFGNSENAKNWYNQLAEDLYQELKCQQLDALILSGDIANKSTPEEYAAAQVFLDNLRDEFKLKPEQIVLVPGNHDLNWELSEDAFTPIRRKNYQGALDEGRYIDNGNYIEIRDEDKYQHRFQHFSEFYKTIKNQPYPLQYEQQAILHHFPTQNLLIVGFNSAWQLDHHYRTRASINPTAVTNALLEIRRSETYQKCLKIAVWHHPLNSSSEDRITDSGFMEQLAISGFRFALHGHIHKAEASLYNYDITAGGRRLNIVCAGTFGAPVREWVPGYPLQYNLLKLEGNKLTVYTRRREELNGAWKPDARWLQGAGKEPSSFYKITL
jgi:HEAT repeat protein/3',5'-cyclic AMP phosphodiesterase CpdA